MLSGMNNPIIQFHLIIGKIVIIFSQFWIKMYQLHDNSFNLAIKYSFGTLFLFLFKKYDIFPVYEIIVLMELYLNIYIKYMFRLLQRFEFLYFVQLNWIQKIIFLYSIFHV